MTEKIAQIYDKLFKKRLTLSNVAVTSLINGLFESESKDLIRRLADTIITISCSHSCHLKAQTVRDNDIVLRVF